MKRKRAYEKSDEEREGELFMNEKEQSTLETLKSADQAMEELNEIPYKSENPGMMHACGHDGHMAMLLTAARILKGMEEEIPGRVRVCFQPGEEVGLGALGMMKDGVLAAR